MNGGLTETTRVSWLSRIKNSVLGLLIGLVLIVAMVWLLFWNEGRTIREARSLAEGAGLVVSVGSGSLEPANEGRLIHVIGSLTTPEQLFDPVFGVRAEGVRLLRKVEMYQWKEEARSETVTKVGGGEETTTTYTYAQVWSDEPQDSAEFKVPSGHENPPMAIHGERFEVTEAKLGAFDLDERILARIEGERSVTLTKEQLTAIGIAAGGKLASRVDDGAFLGIDPTAPSIGDYRIAYTIVPLGTVSVVAMQSGGGLAPYRTTVGNEILLVEGGAVPAARMFAAAEADNALLKWILRAAGLLFLFVAFTLVMAPLGVLGDVLPALGSVVRLGTGLIAFILTVLAGAATIAVAWFWYRPLLAIGVAVLGMAIAAVVIYLGKLRERTGTRPARR